jgi:hypothetical protein
MTDTTCPDEADLLPLTTGEQAAGPVQEHVRECPACRARIKQLQGEITNLRRIRRDSQQTSVIQPPPAPAADSGAAAGDEPSTVSLTGRSRRPAHVGKYFIAGLLDEAQTALVYRALHPTLNKELVIKLGRQEKASPAEHKQLLEEGKRLAQLDHPHLVRVYDLDFHQERPFLVMEYVGGSGLKQLMEEKRPTAVEAAGLVARLARGLAEVHRQGLVHGEINPGNVLIDDAGQPRLDFGLACLHRPTGGEGAAEPVVAGTAPGQVRGTPDSAGPRGDLFGLGRVLYFLLTGKDPFETADHLRRGDWDREALRSAGVPGRLQAICARALAADPAERYAGAAEMAGDLERLVRHPNGLRGVALLALAALGAAVGAGLLYWLLRGGN